MNTIEDKQHVYFRLEDIEALRHPAVHTVVDMDWHADIEMIRGFYRHWSDEVIDPPEDETIGNPLVVVIHDEIVSFAAPFFLREGEVEIGAVATLPAYRNRGYCQAVISEMAYRILKSGRAATLTTHVRNLPMQAAARAIGMRLAK